jgi:thymidylate synthase
MENVELQYLKVAENILQNGIKQQGRNGVTQRLPFQTLDFNISNELPLLTTRQIFYKGVLGEYAAFIRQPKHIDRFKFFGCNYWDKFANVFGDIEIDYGNKWIDWNGHNQFLATLMELKNNPTSRRLVISGWDPSNLHNVDLPCCHYSYQFWSDGKNLSLLWNQRSGDWMVGIPSDMILASVMLLCFASLADLKPQNIKMVIGDAHIYEEHFDNAKLQLKSHLNDLPKYEFKKQFSLYGFYPKDLRIINYNYNNNIKYLLKK